eukprot:RCo002548
MMAQYSEPTLTEGSRTLYETTEMGLSAKNLRACAEAEQASFRLAPPGPSPVLEACQEKLRSVVESPWYRYGVLCAVLANALMLCCFNNTNPDSGLQRAIYSSEVYFTAIFVADIVVRFVAQGWRRCFTSGWYMTDLVVTILSVLHFIPGVVNLSGIRLLYAIKYLHLVPYLEATAIMVSTLQRSVVVLRDLFLLAMVFFTFFGIVGVQIWGGQLGHRCVDPTTGVQVVDFWYGTDSDKVCSLDRLSFQCPGNSTCMDLQAPLAAGTVSFDNILLAWLTLFQTMSTEGWSFNMFHAMDATTPAAVIYFILVVILGLHILVQVLQGLMTSMLCDAVEEHKEARKAAGLPASLVS